MIIVGTLNLIIVFGPKRMSDSCSFVPPLYMSMIDRLNSERTKVTNSITSRQDHIEPLHRVGGATSDKSLSNCPYGEITENFLNLLHSYRFGYKLFNRVN